MSAEVGKTTLGQSDMEVSKLAFGTYHLGTHLDAPAALDLLGRAHDVHGINFIDTSDNYLGAEALIGLALRDGTLRRDEVVIATKTGLAGSQYELREFEDRRVEQDVSPDRMCSKLEGSLRVMGIETIDLYQVHVFDPEVRALDVAAAMNEFIDEGKIKHWGISNYNNPDTISDVVAESIEHDLEGPVSLQNYHNMFRRPYERSVQTARNWGMTVLAFSPLAKGVMTDRYMDQIDMYRESVNLPPEVVEMLILDGEKETYARAKRDLPVMEKLQPLVTYAHDHGANLQRLGIAWLMRQEATIPLLGAYKEEYLDDLVQAATWQLDVEGQRLVEHVIADAFQAV